jgi:DNA-binding NarL/FixJ family response regulator
VAHTVLIVDDFAAFRAAARALLEQDGFEVVGEAADGAEAASAVRSLRPQIVVLDIQLPDADGFAVADAFRQMDPAPIVVLTSSRDALAYVRRLERPGTPPFIPKAELSGDRLAEVVLAAQ